MSPHCSCLNSVPSSHPLISITSLSCLFSQSVWLPCALVNTLRPRHHAHACTWRQKHNRLKKMQMRTHRQMHTYFSHILYLMTLGLSFWGGNQCYGKYHFSFLLEVMNSNEDSLHSHNPAAKSAMRSAQNMRFNTLAAISANGSGTKLNRSLERITLPPGGS